MNQLLLIPDQFQAKKLVMPSTREYEDLARVRLSKHFILRDFLFSTDAASRGLSNFPEDPEHVVKAGKALCDKLLEPILAHFGKFAITFAYQSRQSLEFNWPTELRETKWRNSNPHQWDRKTWGEEVYARVDVMPFCVEDGKVSKMEFGKWCMMNLDIDLLQQWTRSNVFCVSISPKARHVWHEWGDLDAPRLTTFMGIDYWQNVYPNLPKHERPKFGPSHSGGRVQWRKRSR